MQELHSLSRDCDDPASPLPLSSSPLVDLLVLRRAHVEDKRLLSAVNSSKMGLLRPLIVKYARLAVLRNPDIWKIHSIKYSRDS